MDNIKIIYKILKMLEEAMDYEEFDARRITAEHLGISEPRLTAILRMMKERGLIEGVYFDEDMAGNTYMRIGRLRITLDGLEYMGENSLMNRAAKAMKGIKDAIPGA